VHGYLPKGGNLEIKRLSTSSTTPERKTLSVASAASSCGVVPGLWAGPGHTSHTITCAPRSSSPDAGRAHKIFSSFGRGTDKSWRARCPELHRSHGCAWERMGRPNVQMLQHEAYAREQEA